VSHKRNSVVLLWRAKVRSPKQRYPALFGAARAGVVLRYAAFDAVPSEAFSRAANATHTKARSAWASSRLGDQGGRHRP